ncbi:unnamed protein product [Laminaria digitata]
MKPLAEMPHFRSVNSAHFSPGGEWVATVLATHALPHNNQTGRWLTKFQASWDPKSRGLFAIGSMQRGPHGVRR